MDKINTSMAILISGILIALVIATTNFTPRYSIVASTKPSSETGFYVRLDNKTGEICRVYTRSIACIEE